MAPAQDDTGLDGLSKNQALGTSLVRQVPTVPSIKQV